MGPTIITKKKLYRIDPVTKIPTLAYGIGASVPVAEYELLAGEPASDEPTPASTPATPTSPAPAAAEAEPAVKDLTVAVLKARLDELGVEYPKRARHAELVDLVEQAVRAKAAEGFAAANGKVYVTDPETGFTFESGEGHPEHHADADQLACSPSAELLELAVEAGLEDVPDDFGGLEGEALAAAKWALAERIVLFAAREATQE